MYRKWGARVRWNLWDWTKEGRSQETFEPSCGKRISIRWKKTWKMTHGIFEVIDRMVCLASYGCDIAFMICRDKYAIMTSSWRHTQIYQNRRFWSYLAEFSRLLCQSETLLWVPFYIKWTWVPFNVHFINGDLINGDLII